MALMPLDGPAFQEYTSNKLPSYTHLSQTNPKKGFSKQKKFLIVFRKKKKSKAFQLYNADGVPSGKE